MTVDYDLVVVGSSWAGIYAAKSAVKLQARVALVTQSEHLYLPNDTLFNSSLSEIGSFNHRLANNPWLPIETTIPDLSLTAASEEVKQTQIAVQKLDSLSSLAALGVDIIVGKGEFYRLPHLGLQIKHRKLRSRRFLLATGCCFLPSNDLKNYLTLRDLENHNLSSLPDKLIIVGSDPTALALAQTLAKFNKKITLVVQNKRILPQEDRDLSILIQAQLEAIGINIFTDSVVSQIKIINGAKWLQAGDRALVADEIIIIDNRQPNIAGLNLAGVDVKYDQRRVYVNQKLATTNSHIYACGDLIGGYDLLNIARYEVNLILKNTLFFPWYKTDYHTLPWAILTQPNLARVGLSEEQAKQQCQGKVYVIRQYFSQVTQAQILDNLSGVCKLLINQKGEILGCGIFSDRAAELITIPALMMQHKIKLDSNPMRGLTSISIPTIYPSMAEILEQAINNFYQQKIQDNPKLISRLRSWFSLRKK
jgi:pyruvate/2-oxoglutarate dehydrogenase complex dihydrolipoamide dehydrogenase (E3) component